MAVRVHVTGEPSPEQALAMHLSVFPEAGDYVVAKAEPGSALPEQFDEWFLQELLENTRRRFLTAQYAIWETLDDWLIRRGVQVPSNLALWELNRALFDLTTASTARMVGFHVPDDVARELGGLGFTPTEALDFPALAYRMGKMYEALAARTPVHWSELEAAARSFPLASAERSAVAVARERAGVWLKPIFDASGHVWTADREVAPLRARVAAALEARQSVRAVTRELGNSQRAIGVLRDADRVLRTEIAQARSEGSWQEDSKRWKPDAKIFRQTSRNACRDCLRLYKLPDGMPRLYTRADVEAASATGPNRGPREEWTAKIGATHPNCACPPWQQWTEHMAALLAQRAPEYAALMARLAVFPEAA